MAIDSIPASASDDNAAALFLPTLARIARLLGPHADSAPPAAGASRAELALELETMRDHVALASELLDKIVGELAQRPENRGLAPELAGPIERASAIVAGSLQ